MKQMMIALIAAGFVLAPAVCAQDDPAPAAAAEQETSPDAEFDAIEQDFMKAQQTFFEAYRKAPKEKRQELIEKRPRPLPWAKRMLALARKHPKTEAAGKALAWICVHLRGPENSAELVKEAREIIMRDHLNSPAMADLARSMMYGRGSANEIRFLETLIEKNEHRDVKAFAKFSLGKIVAKKDPKRAAALFEECCAFDDVKIFGDMTIAERAKSELYEARNLAIGMRAPEIEGHDVDGVAFKLSDYRGKVVLLDFWGHW